MATAQLALSYLIELNGCEQTFLNNQRWIQDHLMEAAILSGEQAGHELFQMNSSLGVSGSLLNGDTHFSIHTWPDLAYAAVEVFTSNFDLKVQNAIDFLGECLNAKQVRWQKYHRGPSSQIQPFRETHSVSRTHV